MTDTTDTDVTFEPYEDDEVVFTLDNFATQVRDRSLVNSDGFGALATDTQVSDVNVSPSSFMAMLTEGRLPAWATHVAWFNK